MLNPDDLTERQKSVLAFIIDYHQRHRIAPTVREIGKGVGLRSPAGVHRILDILKARGYIHSDFAKSRSWAVSEPLPGKGMPVVGAIAAGDPIEALACMEEELPASPELFGCETCLALRVRGDSMIEAHIMDGDLAIIRPQQQVENGEIAAVQVKGLLTETTLKIIRRFRHTLILEPANQACLPLVFKGGERQRVSIVGKLAGIIRRS